MTRSGRRSSRRRWSGSRRPQGISVDAYLAQHRGDTTIAGLKTYFTSVIDWIGSVFTRPPDKEMRGLEWGASTRRTTRTSYNAAADRRRRRRAPRRSGGRATTRASTSTCWAARPTRSCSTIRLFDDKTKAAAYEQQTQKAKAEGVSNCPLCAIGDNANKTRIYKQDEMDADHVTAWSKGGATDLEQLRDALRHAQPRQGQQIVALARLALRRREAAARSPAEAPPFGALLSTRQEALELKPNCRSEHPDRRARSMPDRTVIGGKSQSLVDTPHARRPAA